MAALQISEQDSVLTITLNRPEVRNAFNDEVIAELSATFTDLAERDEVRAIVLAAEGPLAEVVDVQTPVASVVEPVPGPADASVAVAGEHDLTH